MALYAYFDSTKAAPSPVLGWYDTGFATYPSLPAAADLLEVTAAEWTAHMADPAGWAVQDGALVSYTPPTPTPTLARQAAAMLAAGLTVTSTSTSPLDGTYATDSASQQHIQAVVTAILLNNAFTDGSSSIAWLDASGVSHTFDVAQFKAFATAVFDFVSACLRCVNGQSTTLPSGSATID